MYRRDRVLIFKLVLCLGALSLQAAPPETQLTPTEHRELTARLHDFYAHPGDPAAMNRPVPKTGVHNLRAAHPNPLLKAPQLGQAGLKASDAFRRAKRSFFKKHFAARASVESNDRVSDLAASWVDEVVRNLDELPTSGQSSLTLWSDDYWRTQYGETSYRYAEGKYFPNYKQAVADYAQPADFKALTDKSKVDLWSPAEKYDLTVGDGSFTLTNYEKDAGLYELGPTGNVESWMGICHGWSAAAIMVPKPMKVAATVGIGGIPITWYPHDIRALASLTWANADFANNFIGGRCEAKKPEVYDNGRLKDQDCFDSNPATFHLALGNMIGRAQAAFIIDAAYDYEVWNQPLKSYELTYFNPLNSDEQDKDWKKVAVNYDDKFKAKDRFQTPLTRGKRVEDEKWDDTGIRKVVGVIATVVYLSEITPVTGGKPVDDEETRVTYTYDLELHENEAGQLVPQGGEWHRNAHPDFLWVPNRDTHAVAKGEADLGGLDLIGGAAPSESLSSIAQGASTRGVPLCHLLRGLLLQSADAGAESYACGDR